MGDTEDDRVLMREYGYQEKACKRLFKLCMKGEWKKVVETYETNKNAHTARITRTGDTALHVAVTDGQYDVVQQLVTVLISKDEEAQSKEALRIRNQRGNTVLHFAAMRSVEMCRAFVF